MYHNPAGKRDACYFGNQEGKTSPQMTRMKRISTDSLLHFRTRKEEIC